MEIIADIPLPARKAENELKNYLSMPKVTLNQILLFWQKSHETFPTLKVLAKEFLPVRGTRCLLKESLALVEM